jgi:predicted deacylase
MKIKQPLTIMGEVVAPGERKEILMPIPKLYDGSPLYSHIHVLNGGNPGPVLCLAAALHGDELNGIEIINRVLQSRQLNNLKRLNGAIVAVPVVNVYGFLYQQRYLMDRRDLNRSFPGSQKGSLAARTANLFYHEVFKKCTHIIDFHTGSLHRSNLPQVRAKLNNDYIKNMANVFGAPVVLNSNIRTGSLREVACKDKISVIVYEAGEALRLDPIAIRFGISGVFNMINYLGISNTVKIKSHRFQSLVCETSAWIRSKNSGLFNTTKKLGQSVHQGEKLGIITNPMTLEDEVIKTPISGIIIGINNSPLIHEGSALFNIASPEKLTRKQISVLELLDNDEVETMIDPVK